MKYALAIIATLLICAGFFLAQSYSEYQKQLFTVYDVDNKYTQTFTGADVTIVDFSRFGCNHCRNLHPVLKKAIALDGRVRYSPRLVTFGRVWDETLATAVYAAAEQGKFIDMHDEIYKNWPVESHKKLMRIAESLGLNMNKFTQDIKDPAIIDRMREDQEYFDTWYLGRTPSVLFGKSMIFQPVDNVPTAEELVDRIEKVRK